MTREPTPIEGLGDRSLFLVWGPPSHGPRSKVFARKLGIETEFVYSTKRRGLLAAPFKYSYQMLATLRLLFRRRPRIVFVQSPPSFAALYVYLYCAATRSRFVIDAHSAAFQVAYWTRPRWLYRFLARRAVATIVTNEYFANGLRRDGAEALVLRDIPTEFPGGTGYALDGSFNVIAVNTFAPDEPVADLLAAARGLDGVTFHVTGDLGRADRKAVASPPRNVRFTGYLSDESYYDLMRASDAVLCLTTRDHTMQRGACEALSLGVPVVTSHWPLLKDYFNKGTVHVDNTTVGIRAGVREMQQHHDRYRAGIAELQAEQQKEWEAALEALSRLLGSDKT